MPIGMRTHRWVEPKLAYEAWAKTGSIYRAGLWLKSEKGQYNYSTGEPFSSQGIWMAANTYIINNLREARVIYDEVMRSNGFMPNDLTWYEFIIPKVLKLAPENYEEFMKKNSYLKPYMDKYIAEKQTSS